MVRCLNTKCKDGNITNIEIKWSVINKSVMIIIFEEFIDQLIDYSINCASLNVVAHCLQHLNLLKVENSLHRPKVGTIKHSFLLQILYIPKIIFFTHCSLEIPRRIIGKQCRSDQMPQKFRNFHKTEIYNKNWPDTLLLMSYLGLYCLPVILLGVSGLKWVTVLFRILLYYTMF